MDDEQENVREKSFDFNEHLIDKVWIDEMRGLRKEVLHFNFISIIKPSELSKCLVDVLDIKNLNNHNSNYLTEHNDFSIDIGHGITAIDCYVEEFLKQMLMNETSKCEIITKSETITFTMRLKQIEFGGYYHEQPPYQMFELAKQYKENGVKMFKEYPLFAHNYFNLAAKCLLSFNTQDANYEELLKDSGITKKDFDELLENVYLNIAACLIKQERYEEVLSILDFVLKQQNPSEKAVFRLATAYFHVNKFGDAESLLKKIDFKSKKDLSTLMGKIQDFRKAEKDKSSNMAKKMIFG